MNPKNSYNNTCIHFKGMNNIPHITQGNVLKQTKVKRSKETEMPNSSQTVQSASLPGGDPMSLATSCFCWYSDMSMRMNPLGLS